MCEITVVFKPPDRVVCAIVVPLVLTWELVDVPFMFIGIERLAVVLGKFAVMFGSREVVRFEPGRVV